MSTQGEAEFTAPAVLLEQEQTLRLDHIDEVTCYRIGSWIAERSLQASQTVTVVVVLDGRTVYKAALPGTSAGNDMIIEGKARVSHLGQHSSLYERNRYLAEGTTFEAVTGLSQPEYAPYGGSVPLIATAGVCEGLVVVSGLSQEDDHDLAVAGIRSAQQP
jgi:uncharacterized protein (UPF0303 family)